MTLLDHSLGWGLCCHVMRTHKQFIEKSMWQGSESSCQQPCEWTPWRAAPLAPIKPLDACSPADILSAKRERPWPESPRPPAPKYLINKKCKRTDISHYVMKPVVMMAVSKQLHLLHHLLRIFTVWSLLPFQPLYVLELPTCTHQPQWPFNPMCFL